MEIYNNFVEYCEALGIELRSSGNRFVAHCPLPTHNGTDTNPSFTIYPETGTFYCFGCLNGGDAFELARLLGKEPPVVLQKQIRRTIPKYFDPSDEQIEIMTRFCRSCNHYLPKPIREYLNNRGFTDEEIERFQLGYANGNRLHLSLAERKLAYLLGMTSLFGSEFFRNHVIIPEIRDNKIIWFQGRILDTSADLKTKYLNVKLSPPLFGVESCANSKYLWVTEGTLDALALISNKEPAVALIGTTLSARHRDFFFGRIVRMCLDSDDAGRAAVGKLKSQLRGVAMITIDIRLPEGIKDVAELKERGELEKWLNRE